MKTYKFKLLLIATYFIVNGLSEKILCMEGWQNPMERPQNTNNLIMYSNQEINNRLEAIRTKIEASPQLSNYSWSRTEIPERTNGIFYADFFNIGGVNRFPICHASDVGIVALRSELTNGRCKFNIPSNSNFVSLGFSYYGFSRYDFVQGVEEGVWF